MMIGDYVFMTDSVSKFFNTLRISGWFHHPDDTLTSVALTDPHVIASSLAIGLQHDGVASFGSGKGFSLQVLRDEEGYDPEATVHFTTLSGWQGTARLGDMVAERASRVPTAELMWRFQADMHARPKAAVLDIGGRSRSGLARRDLFTVDSYTVLDVVADPSVDVVGDAHALGELFPADHFDGILSVSVFEHLLMPWAVAVQMNRVLKPGGVALVFTHQTLGMHDIPWDFWRFSDTAWDALFNRHTGFEIIDRALDREQFIIPFAISEGKLFAERAAGFEGSAVLVRKTGPCRMRWPLTAADITATHYPE